MPASHGWLSNSASTVRWLPKAQKKCRNQCRRASSGSARIARSMLGNSPAGSGGACLGAAQARLPDMHLETPLADLPGLHHHLVLLGLAPERGKQHVERVGGEVTQRVLQAVLAAADAGEGFLQLALVLQQHVDIQPSGLLPRIPGGADRR